MKCTKLTRLETLSEDVHLLSAQRIYSAQRCTASSVAQRAALPGAHRYTAPSIAQCPALHCIANIAQLSVLPAVSPSLRKRGGHRRLAKRERKAPQAKPPAGRGVGGRAPNYSKQNLDEYFHVTRAQFQALYAQQARGRWWILEYGKVMRRLTYTECRQVCELQTHTNSTQRRKLQSAPATRGAKEMRMGGAPPPG